MFDQYEYRIRMRRRWWSRVLQEWQPWSDWYTYRGFNSGKEVFTYPGMKLALKAAQSGGSHVDYDTRVQRRPIVDDWEDTDV